MFGKPGHEKRGVGHDLASIMETMRLYRGGPSLKARVDEVRLDRATGRLKNNRGISVYDRPDHHNLVSHGGAFALGELPGPLRVIQAGRDPSHHEIVPAVTLSLTFEEYQELLDQITVTPVPTSSGEQSS